MMEGSDNFEKDRREEIFSKPVRAGKRTYFFDVKATKRGDYYLTITESKRRFRDGKYFYEKHKVFLYKEDFEKFSEGLTDAIEEIKRLKREQGEEVIEKISTPNENQSSESNNHTPTSGNHTPKDREAEVTAQASGQTEFTDVNFEDLGGDGEEIISEAGNEADEK